MTVPASGSNLGRRLFGAATLAFGIFTLLWPAYYDWLGVRHLWGAHANQVFAATASAAQILGGAATQFRRTVGVGGIALAAAFFAFAALCVPQIIAAPRVYDHWGNFFEQFSLATGAAILVARASRVRSSRAIGRIGCIVFGLCVASFAAEQAVYLGATATLVPKWIPPSQTFWAVATTVAFALAAVALLVDRMALLATRLLTIMIGAFGLLVWVPLVLSDPRSQTNWSECIETAAITGAAWILADLLGPQAGRDA